MPSNPVNEAKAGNSMKSKQIRRLALGLTTTMVAFGAATGSAFAAAPTAVTATAAPVFSGATGNALDAANNLKVYNELKTTTWPTRTCTPGAASSCVFTRYIYQWFRSTSANPGNTAGDWAAISSSAGAWYKVKRNDVGFKVRVRVRICYNDGSPSNANELCSSASGTPNNSWSAASPLITHSNTTLPALSNTSPPFYTRTLWAGEGVWDGNPSYAAHRTFTYQWEACTNAVTDGAGTPVSVSDCSNVDAQSGTVTLKASSCQPNRPAACTQNQGSTYKAFTLPQGKYIGKYLRCKITSTIAGITVSAYTNATKAVYNPAL